MEVMSDETISNSDSHNHAGQFIREVKGSNPSRSTKQFVLEPNSL